jgi:DNA (cytosine-5)-methyltransferase 1
MPARPKLKAPRKHPAAKDHRYLSFFSGALGLDLGFEAAGYECLSVNEIDRVTCKTIHRNLKRAFPKHQPRVYDYDVRDLTAAFLCKDLGIKPGELFTIIGGPPCQAFSTAGKRLGLNDERGNVFLHFIHLIGKLQPRYAVFENVRGLLSAPLIHRPHNERGKGYPPLTEEEMPKGALKRILCLLESYGYKVTFNLYNTANFGVPQKRERLIFFASREGEEIPYLFPTNDEKGDYGLLPWKTLRTTLKPLKGKPFEAGKFPEARLKYYRLLSEGQNWRDLPVSFQQKAMGKSWFAGGGKTGFFRRLAWDKPSPTLVTSPTMPATDLCHPEELRPLSVEEYAAIQTYPTWFSLEGGLSDKYKQLGNAVPTLFGKSVADHLLAFDEGRMAVDHAQRLSFSRYIGTDHSSWQGAGMHCAPTAANADEGPPRCSAE